MIVPGRPIVAIPGPTPVREEILAALAEPTLGHGQAEFVEIYRRAIAAFRGLVRAHEAVVIGGAGTLAMEMALVNCLQPEDSLLVVSHGLFGDRFAQMARRFRWNTRTLAPDRPGRAVDPSELAEALRGGGYRAVTVTHVDTSTGVRAPVEQYAEVLRGSDAYFILDGVCATAGLPEPMDELGVDYLVTTSQKAMGVPPGFALLGLSGRAVARRAEMGEAIGAYYADLANWLPIMRDPSGYFATPPTNMVVALERGLRLVEQEGLPARFARHERQGRAMRAAWSALGLELLAAPGFEAPTLSVLRYPQGVQDAAFRAAAERDGAYLAGGVGELKGRVFRVGHMGNATRGELLSVVAAIESALAACGHPVTAGAGVGAAAAVLAEAPAPITR
jgi:alanine-glyoxylate transaminase/serine-glyoxylate transaminase/serine-pyruvate transaminase